MEALRLLDFVSVAIKRSGRWMLVLDFFPTDDEEADWSSISWTIPWLSELRADHRNACVGTQLRRHGLALVACENEEEARRLLNQIQGYRVGATVFTDTGEKTSWGLSGNPPSAKREKKRTRPKKVKQKKIDFRLIHGTFNGSRTKH